jgi:hypothetical protein
LNPERGRPISELLCARHQWACARAAARAAGCTNGARYRASLTIQLRRTGQRGIINEGLHLTVHAIEPLHIYCEAAYRHQGGEEN